MTPERWEAVDAILQAALACDPARRDAFVAERCAGDDALHDEVRSLLAAHDGADASFLERPAAESSGIATPAVERLARALVGRYAIEGELAHGGMATVYLARDLRHERRVAIKVLREELSAAVGAERFLAEIRVTASLQHPHILPLFDSGSADGVLWYVMPLVEGETLRSRLSREGRLPVDVALQFAREIAGALDHAHQQGVVHRDVKPENVLLQGGHALVADFGIALALEQAGGDRLTRTGIMIGTPQYMAPEQADGKGVIDARADVYALGAVVHEMIAGESPFAAMTPQAMLRRVREGAPTALATRSNDVSPELDAAVRKALSKRPEERFPGAAAFASALSAAAKPPVTREEPTSPPPVGRHVSARAAVYAGLAMLIVGLGGGLILARSSLLDRVASAVPQVSPPAITGGGWTGAGGDGLTLAILDRTGRTQRVIPARRPWTPRFSPDGRRLAFGAFGEGRNTSDLWVTDLVDNTTTRLTDDEGDANDPQWDPKGTTIAYSVNAPGGKDLRLRVLGYGKTSALASRDGTQYASDWLRDGSALLVTDESEGNARDILIQPATGGEAWPYLAEESDDSAPRISPDGRWVAYASNESGTQEVYIDAFPKPGQRIPVSLGGGVDPTWRADGRELYYWSNGSLIAVRVGEPSANQPPALGARSVLFKAPYHANRNTMYDVSPDGQRFAVVLGR